MKCCFIDLKLVVFCSGSKVLGDEKWIYFVRPDEDSIPVQDIYGQKTSLCICWTPKGVQYYELLQLGETITGDRY